MGRLDLFARMVKYGMNGAPTRQAGEDQTEWFTLYFRYLANKPFPNVSLKVPEMCPLGKGLGPPQVAGHTAPVTASKGKPTMTKDNWDKGEIIAKAAGSIVIPIAVAISVYLWNVERSQRDTAAQMTTIAVSILTEKPEESSVGNDPLRRWAISVLRNPEDPPVLSEAAARELEMRTIGIARSLQGFWSTSGDEVERITESIEAFRRYEESLPTPEIDW